MCVTWFVCWAILLRQLKCTRWSRQFSCLMIGAHWHVLFFFMKCASYGLQFLCVKNANMKHNPLIVGFTFCKADGNWYLMVTGILKALFYEWCSAVNAVVLLSHSVTHRCYSLALCVSLCVFCAEWLLCQSSCRRCGIELKYVCTLVAEWWRCGPA